MRKNKYKFSEELDLSILIPVYNGEKYIHKCIESILEQKTKYSYEIIIVNDGSTDYTLNILNKFNLNKNIIILNQMNKGISAARNKAIDYAKGKYLMFIDSDDTILPYAVENMLNEAYKEDADIVEGKYINYLDNNIKYLDRPLWNKKIKVNIQDNMKFIHKVKGYPWGKIYSRDLWDNVRFPIGLDYEDTIIQLIIFRKAKTYVYIPNLVYSYVYNNNSITNKLKKNIKCLDSFYIIEALIKENYILNLEFDCEFYSLILNHLGRLLYIRTQNMDDFVIDAILVQASELLKSLEGKSPQNLSVIEKYLKRSIIDKDKYKWILCCKYM
ncbi:TPA: glycosyltransferase family 2 protein [Clostridium perfringens]